MICDVMIHDKYSQFLFLQNFAMRQRAIANDKEIHRTKNNDAFQEKNTRKEAFSGEQSIAVPVSNEVVIGVLPHTTESRMENNENLKAVSASLFKTAPTPAPTPTSTTLSIEDYRYLPLAHEMGYHSVKMKCPFCHKIDFTEVKDTFGFRSHLWMIFNFCLCCCLSFAPFFVKSVS